LKDDVGLEFQSKDQFVDELNKFKEYKSDPYNFLQPEIKAHAEFLAAGGNTQEFYRLKAIDFKSLPDKEVLFQDFLRDHPDYAKDQDFARKFYDRQYKNEYSILESPKKTQEDFITEDGDSDPIAYRDYLDNYEFAQKSLAFKGQAAREKLVSWQEKATSPPMAQGNQMSKEEADKIQSNYLKAIDQIKTSYQGEQIPISDNPEENIKIGLNGKVKNQWESDLQDPLKLFQDLGLNPNGTLDPAKLARTSFIFRIFDDLGPIASKLILEKQARQTVTGQQINPQTPQTQNTAPPGVAYGDDDEAEAAELFIQQMSNGRR